MHNELKDKVEAMETEHFEGKAKDLVTRGTQEVRDRAMQMLGAARYAEQLIKRTGADLMTFLALVEEEKLYLEYDYPDFATFLSQSPMVQFSKSQYYNRKQLLAAEGTETYDFYEEWGISPALRKKLQTAGIHVVVDGDEIVIDGTDRIKVSEPSIVKTILEQQISEKLKLSEKVEKQKETIARGQQELQQLQRNYDALQDDSPFARTLMKTVGAFSDLMKQVRELPEAERQSRGSDDLQTIASLYFRLRDTYGVSTPLAQTVSVTPESTFDEKVAAELAKDDDWGDEEVPA